MNHRTTQLATHDELGNYTKSVGLSLADLSPVVTPNELRYYKLL